MIRAVVVVADVACPSCSQIARELPDLLRVPVTVRSCRDPRLAGQHPTLPTTVLACRTPALGTIRRDGSVRWWPGLSGAIGVLPVVRPRALREALGVLWTAWRARRR
ncbi:hypothetical protein [Pseudonocardia adelaidensis]|uniref:hypothetical protein n=1 Tax=Pseudonocardia adelaidensis TaxID=648754 RepID=UPI0031EC6F14